VAQYSRAAAGSTDTSFSALNSIGSGGAGGRLERSGSIQSLSQAPFNTSLSFSTPHGLNPLPSVSIFTSETVPLAVAFCETVDAYFSGTGTDSRSVSYALLYSV